MNRWVLPPFTDTTGKVKVMDTTKIIEELRDDGDEVELADGRVLRLRYEADESMTVEDDSDWFGRIEWARRENAYGHAVRPSGFDGGAEVLYYNRGDRCWWQPPTDAVKDGRLRDTLRRQLNELLECGYRLAIVELCDGRDVYGHRIVVAVQTLGGIAPFDDVDDGYLADMVNEVFRDVNSMTPDAWLKWLGWK